MIEVKPFLLFAGNDYYPEGGAYDFVGSFDSIKEAKSAHIPEKYQYDGGWANIFDLNSEKVVRHFYRGEWYSGKRRDY